VSSRQDRNGFVDEGTFPAGNSAPVHAGEGARVGDDPRALLSVEGERDLAEGPTRTETALAIAGWLSVVGSGISAIVVVVALYYASPWYDGPSAFWSMMVCLALGAAALACFAASLHFAFARETLKALRRLSREEED